VEQTHCEKTLVLSQEKAQALFERASTVPANVSKIITEDFYKFTPNAAKSNYGSSYINRPNFTQNFLISDPQVAVDRIKARIQEARSACLQQDERVHQLDEEHSRAVADFDKGQSAIFECDKKLRELYNLKECLKLELSALDESGDNYLKRQIAAKKMQIDEADCKLKAKKAAKATAVAEEREARRLKVEEEEKCKADERERRKDAELEDELRETTKEERILRANMEKWKRAKTAHQALLLEAEKEAQTMKYKYESSQNAALQLTDGKELDVNKTLKQIIEAEKANQKMLTEGKRRIGSSSAEVVATMKEKYAEISQLQKHLKAVEKNQMLADAMKQQRIDCFCRIRGHIVRSVKVYFADIASDHGMSGELKVNFMEQKLTVLGSAGANVDVMSVSNMSGGERSKMLICFLYSLWMVDYSPFRCLDEWDVFVDEKTRSQIEEMLAAHALTSPYQHIFVSPQNTSTRSFPMNPSSK